MNKSEVASRAKNFGIRSVPKVVIDGKLASCCADRGLKSMCCVLHWHKWSVPVPGRLEIESPFCSEGAVGGEGLTMSKGLDRFSSWRRSARRILREFEEKGALHAPRDEQRKMNSLGGCQAVASGTSP